MYEHLGLAAILLMLALAGHLGEPEPPCCQPRLALGPAVFVFD